MTLTNCDWLVGCRLWIFSRDSLFWPSFSGPAGVWPASGQRLSGAHAVVQHVALLTTPRRMRGGVASLRTTELAPRPASAGSRLLLRLVQESRPVLCLFWRAFIGEWSWFARYWDGLFVPQHSARFPRILGQIQIPGHTNLRVKQTFLNKLQTE